MAVATAILASSMPLAAPSVASALPRRIFGIVSGVESLDQAGRQRAWGMLQDAGCTWYRGSFYWPYIDRNGVASRDWAVQDTMVAECPSHGITVIGLLSGYAAWANGGKGDFYPPSDPTEFANFAGAAAARYKGRVHYWEVWNEENGPDFWKPAIDPVAYAKMLRATYLAIKRADPNATVVFGGIDRNDYGYLNKVYATLKSYPDAAANHNFFDVLACHPYADNRPPESTDPAFIWTRQGMDRNFSGLPKMKKAMEAQGDATKHIMVTEMAWSVTDVWWRGVGLTNQAEYLKRAYLMALNWPWLDNMLWFGFKDYNGYEVPFSLINSDWSARPSYLAYKGVSLGEITTGGAGPGSGAGSGGTTGGATATRTTLTASRYRAKAGAYTTLATRVWPYNQRGRRVALQRYRNSRWITATVRTLRAGSRATYRYRVRKGLYRWRAWFLGATDTKRSLSKAIVIRGV